MSNVKESRRNQGGPVSIGKGSEGKESDLSEVRVRISIAENETRGARTYQDFAKKGRHYESLGSSEKT